MKVLVKNRYYTAKYVPFFRIRQHEKASKHYKYGIRWPSGHIEYIFLDREKSQVEQMKEVLRESINTYGLQEPRYLNDYEKRMRNDVRELFGIRD